MKQFLMGAAVATAVLGAAGFAAFKEPAAAVAVKKTVPLKLSDLTLDRAFRYSLPIGTLSSPPVVISAPADQGFVFTHFGTTTQYAGVTNVAVSVNGGPEEIVPVGRPTGDAYIPAPIAPPFILRPGESISFGSLGQGNYTLTIGGYFVYPGEV